MGRVMNSLHQSNTRGKKSVGFANWFQSQFMLQTLKILVVGNIHSICFVFHCIDYYNTREVGLEPGIIIFPERREYSSFVSESCKITDGREAKYQATTDEYLLPRIFTESVT